MDKINEDPFERIPVTLEDLKVHDDQLEFPGLEKRLWGIRTRAQEQNMSLETKGTKAIINSLGEVALGGAQA